MPLDAVFFDLDGTLLDTSVDLAHALNKTREHHGLPALAVTEIRQHVSNGAAALIRLGFGEALEPERFAHLRKELLHYYLEDIASYTKPFDGIEELIQRLTDRGIPWGIVTNKPQLYTEALMRHFQFASAPAATVSPDQVGVGKPDPASLLYACEHVGAQAQNCVYVGDHLRDIECGHNAGMPTVGVGYGFTTDPLEFLSWNADHTAPLASDIWPIIEQHYL